MQPDGVEIGPHTRESRMMGGRARLLQPLRGYRAGMDAALLAAAIQLKPGQRGLEIGCGAGAALVQAALRNPAAPFTGVERDPAALSLADRNIALNGLEDRVDARPGAVADGFRALGLDRVDAVFANPPFFDDHTRLRGPAPARVGAWMAEDGLGAWIALMVDALKDGGQLILIHRADRLGDILSGLAPRTGSIRIRPVQPFADQPAKRVVVRAVRGGRAPLVLLPALVLHDRSGAKHAAAADSILRGEAALDWTT
jgi:tRNA1(Val) A37 N6-methylase TrmN6